MSRLTDIADLRSSARRIAAFVFVAVAPILLNGCGSTQPKLPVVDFVDLERYVGKWYEIARYPNAFEEGCAGVTAEYSVREDGRIDVINSCRQGGLEGEEQLANGIARVVDDGTNARLRVSFFWPFEGDYWVLMLGDDYEYAVVGEPARNLLWILSRTPQMDDATYASILEQLPSLSYDPERLERTVQPTTVTE